MFHRKGVAVVSTLLALATAVSLSGCSASSDRSVDEAKSVVVSSHDRSYVIPPLENGKIRNDNVDVLIWNEVALAQDSRVEHVVGTGANNMTWEVFVKGIPDSAESQADIVADLLHRLGDNYDTGIADGGSDDYSDSSWCVELFDDSVWGQDAIKPEFSGSDLDKYFDGAEQGQDGVCFAPADLSNVKRV